MLHRRILALALLAVALFISEAVAQIPGGLCPPPARFLPGGGGLECFCPDGTPYGLGGSCAAEREQDDGRVWCSAESWCQPGTTCCGDQCCHAGSYCSRYGCTPYGAVECGGHYCNPGQQCGRAGGCQPAGSVDCGAYYCQQGQKCGSGWRACLAEDAVDCGAKFKTSCPAGRTCWTPSADYGSARKGQVYCPTSQQAADAERAIREIAENKRREERERREAAALEKKRQAEEARERARLKEQERLADVARKKQEAEDKRRAEIEARKKADEERKLAAEAEAKRKAEAEAARRQAAAEAEARRKAEEEAKRQAAAEAKRKAEEDALFDKQLRAIMSDPKESLVQRQIAAIALGRDPASIVSGRLTAAAQRTVRESSAAERDIARIALAKSSAAPTAPTIPVAERLRAIMNDPAQSPAARRIASLALGSDPATLRTPVPPAPGSAPLPGPVQTLIPAAAPTPSAGYTFTPTRYGTVQIAQDGKIVATTTPQLAQQQYGYRVPATWVQAPNPSSAGAAATPSAGQGGKASAPVAQPQQDAALWTSLKTASNAGSRTSAGSGEAAAGRNQAATAIANLSRNAGDIGQLKPPAPAADQAKGSAEPLARFYGSPVTGFTSPGPPVATVPGLGPASLSAGARIGTDGGSMSILGVSRSVVVSAGQRSGQVGNFSSSIDVASVRGDITATVGPKSVSVDLSTGVTVVQSNVSYRNVSLSTAVGTAEAHATANVGLTGASMSVGAGANLVQDKLDAQFAIGKFKVDVYAEGGVGVDAHADAKLGAKGATLAAGLGFGPEVGLGLDISPNSP